MKLVLSRLLVVVVFISVIGTAHADSNTDCHQSIKTGPQNNATSYLANVLSEIENFYNNEGKSKSTFWYCHDAKRGLYNAFNWLKKDYKKAHEEYVNHLISMNFEDHPHHKKMSYMRKFITSGQVQDILDGKNNTSVELIANNQMRRLTKLAKKFPGLQKSILTPKVSCPVAWDINETKKTSIEITNVKYSPAKASVLSKVSNMSEAPSRSVCNETALAGEAFIYPEYVHNIGMEVHDNSIVLTYCESTYSNEYRPHKLNSKTGLMTQWNHVQVNSQCLKMDLVSGKYLSLDNEGANTQKSTYYHYSITQNISDMRKDYFAEKNNKKKIGLKYFKEKYSKEGLPSVKDFFLGNMPERCLNDKFEKRSIDEMIMRIEQGNETGALLGSTFHYLK